MKNLITNKKNILNIMAIAALSVFLHSCSDDDDASVDQNIDANEEELITTVNLEFRNSNGDLSTFSFRDPDGDGGNAPVIQTIELDKGEEYSVLAKFLDESDPDDVEDITAEILEEDDEHLICFEATNVDGLTITRTDTDGEFEVGLESAWIISDTAVSNSGVVQLVLKHQPGVKDGSCAPGDTDVEVDFPFQLK